MREELRQCRFTQDDDVDAGYVYLHGPIRHGAVARTVEVPGESINLDFGADGTLLGVEVYARSGIALLVVQSRPSAPPPDLSDVLTDDLMVDLRTGGNCDPFYTKAEMRENIIAALIPFLAQRDAARDRQIADATQRGDDFRAEMLAAVLERDDGKARYDRLAAAAQALRIDANRLCDRNEGGSYEQDCRKSIADFEAAIVGTDAPDGRALERAARGLLSSVTGILRLNREALIENDCITNVRVLEHWQLEVVKALALRAALAPPPPEREK